MPIDIGCVYSKALRFKQRSDGTPMDITTWQFEANLRDVNGDVALELSTSNGNFTIADGANGLLVLSMTETETADLTAGPVTAVVYRIDTERVRFAKLSELVREAE